MTQLDILYRFGVPPTEAATMAIARLREVYGVRKLALDEAARTIRVEYDASRLTEPVIQQMLRRAGLDLVEEVSLVNLPVPDPAPDTAPPPQPAR